MCPTPQQSSKEKRGLDISGAYSQENKRDSRSWSGPPRSSLSEAAERSAEILINIHSPFLASASKYSTNSNRALTVKEYPLDCPVLKNFFKPYKPMHKLTLKKCNLNSFQWYHTSMNHQTECYFDSVHFLAKHTQKIPWEESIMFIFSMNNSS